MSGRYYSDSEDYDSDSAGDYSDDEGGKKDFTCQKCYDKPKFTNSRQFKNHLATSKQHDYCEKCDKDFDSWDDLVFHKMKSPLHIICVDCKKEFQSVGGLNTHRKQYHRTAQPLPCPGCKQEFTNASGLMQHLENNTCESGVGKADLHRRIGEAQKALADITMREDNESEIQTPEAAAAASLKVVDYVSITEQSGNTPAIPEESKKFKAIVDETKVQIENWDAEQKVYICREVGCKKKFQKLQSILQHLNSDTHAVKNFRCPACLNTFKSASALTQHIESATCKMGTYDAGKKMVTEFASGW